MKIGPTDPYPKLGSFAFTYRSLDAHGIGISLSSNFAVLYEASQQFLMHGAPLDRDRVARAALTFERRLGDGAALAADDVYPITHGGVVHVSTKPLAKGASLSSGHVVSKPIPYNPHWLAEHVILAFDPAAPPHHVPGLLERLFSDPKAKGPGGYVQQINKLAKPVAQAITECRVKARRPHIKEYVKIFDEWTGFEYTRSARRRAQALRRKFRNRLCAWKPPGGGATRSIVAFFEDGKASAEALVFLRERKWWAKRLIVTDGVSAEFLRSDGGVRFTAGHRVDLIGAADLGQDWRIGEPGRCVSCAIEPRSSRLKYHAE